MQRALPCHTSDVSCWQAHIVNTPIMSPMRSSHTTPSPDGCDIMGLHTRTRVVIMTWVWPILHSCGGREATPTVGSPCCRSPTGQPSEGPYASSQIGDHRAGDATRTLQEICPC
eukprot:5525466-Amphidinium_carterae.4